MSILDQSRSTLIFDIFKNFIPKASICNIELINSGNINTTYLIHIIYNNKSQKYILQHINSTVFADSDIVMKKLLVVNRGKATTISESSQQDNSFTIQIPHPLPNQVDGGHTKIINGEHWRVLEFIDKGETYTRNPNYF